MRTIYAFHVNAVSASSTQLSYGEPLCLEKMQPYAEALSQTSRPARREWVSAEPCIANKSRLMRVFEGDRPTQPIVREVDNVPQMCKRRGDLSRELIVTEPQVPEVCHVSQACGNDPCESILIQDERLEVRQ
jgi:hypothetical protein